MKLIPLTNSKEFVLIDDQHFNRVSKYRWCRDQAGYVRSTNLINGKQQRIHRMIKKGEHIHHVNGNVLDNRSQNLRPMDASEHTILHHLGKYFGPRPKIAGEKNPMKRPEVRALLEGEKNGNHKLSISKVREIRSKYVPMKYSLKRLAKEFGVCKSQIYYIVTNRNWRLA